MITDVLGLPIETVTITTPYAIDTFYKDHATHKLQDTEVDLKAELSDGSVVTIEVQLQQHQFFKERVLYYALETYIANYSKQTVGNKYRSLTPVFGINIIDFILFPQSEGVLQHFELYNKAANLPYQRSGAQPPIALTFFELAKRQPHQRSVINEWRRYFKTGVVSKQAPPYLQQACHLAQYQNLSKEERTMVDATQKARDIQEAFMADAEERGIERGIERGERQNQMKIIHRMRTKGMSNEEISVLTGIESSEIKRLMKTALID